MTEWQPIATAPRDGRLVIIHRKEIGVHNKLGPIRCMRWRGNHWRETTSAGSYWQDHHLTHWMPLPDPPEAVR